MKKILLLTALGATMLASCSQDEALEGASQQRREISFRSLIGATTRTNVADLSSMKAEDAGFKVSAFRYAGSGETKSISTDPHFQNLMVVWESPSWSHDTRYWPGKNEYVSGTTQAEGLDFLAISPKETSDVTFDSDVMTVSDYTPATAAADQTDLLVAYTPDQTETNASSGVPLAFKHALSQVEVTATNNSEFYQIDIQKVEIHNVHGKETMTLGYNTALNWTAADTDVSSRVYSTTALTSDNTLSTTALSFHADENYFMMLPQTTDAWDNKNQTANADADAYFVVYCKIYRLVEGNKIYALGVGDASNWGKVAIPIPANGENSKVEWKAGYKYTYILNFFKDDSGAGYVPPTPTGETPTGDEGKSAIPGEVLFKADVTVSDWTE